MPISPVSFTLGQNPLYPNEVVAVDTSTGSDIAVTERRIYIQDAEGNYLVETGTLTDYNVWPIADASITLDLLTEDLAVNSTTNWVDISGNILYTASTSGALTQYSKQFGYYLMQLTGLTPRIPADTNYDLDVAILWSLIVGAINAVSEYGDIAAAQNNLNRATQMRLKEAIYF